MSEQRQGASSRIGQALVIIGILLVYGVGAFWLSFELIGDDKTPWWIKIGVPTLVVGFSVLFVTVLIQRIQAAKTDKYTDVQD